VAAQQVDAADEAREEDGHVGSLRSVAPRS
jgi:hypothetical protein